MQIRNVGKIVKMSTRKLHPNRCIGYKKPSIVFFVLTMSCHYYLQLQWKCFVVAILLIKIDKMKCKKQFISSRKIGRKVIKFIENEGFHQIDGDDDGKMSEVIWHFTLWIDIEIRLSFHVWDSIIDISM